MDCWKWYVYIILCLDNTFYTGLTWNIPNRIEQHQSKLGSRYTRTHGFKKLVYVEEHNSLEVARYRERQIKDWSRAKKLKLISGKWKKEW